jgi:hypothetical protein
MKYIDVRLRIPINKMGVLVESLPEWAAMIGYDKLAESEPKPVRKYRKNGEYKPTGARLAVMRIVGGKKLRPMDIIAKLSKQHHPKAISTAIHGLKGKGLLMKHEDGTYGKAK